MKKKIIIFIVLVAFILIIKTDVYAEKEYSNNYIDIEVPQEIIDEYEEYLKNNEEDDSQYIIRDIDGNITTASVNDEKYSSVDAGYITAVKNQMSTGSCWAHAGLSVLETAAVKEGKAPIDLNLSEMHLVYGTNASAFSDKEIKNRFYLGGPLNSTNNGGNIIMTASYLYSGLGAIDNSLFPLKSYSSYAEGEVSPVNSSGKEKQITTEEYASIPSTPKFYVDDFYRSYGTKGSCASSVNVMKKMILNYGSAQVSVDWQNANLHNSYYLVNTTTKTTNHAITAVGWDDTIEASKFGFEDETKKGGWIIKNSWGTGKGKKGYYYVSYYDNTVCGSVATFSGIDTNKYDHTYDSSGMYLASYLYALTSKSVYQASVFENEGTSENLEKVSFAVNPGYSYTAYYAPYNDGAWKTNQSSWVNLGTINASDVNYYGIKSINVSNAHVKISDKYVIIVKGTKPNTSTYNNATVTYKEKTYTKKTISTIKMDLVEDENYYSTNGTSWTDLYDYEYIEPYPCENGDENGICYNSTKAMYDGAQNVIYAYTKDDSTVIDATIIDASNQPIANFYSFDDSKFKLDIANIDTAINDYSAIITNSKGVDYTEYFDISVDNINKQVLISNRENKYMSSDVYELTLKYSDGLTATQNYIIKSSLTVSKPFKIKNLSVTTSDGLIYPDTSFNVVLSDYASTLKNQNLTYTITSNSIDVTNLFNINYSSGKVSISPKAVVNSGVYSASISIAGADEETINFEVHAPDAITIGSTIINSNNQSIANFYSFDSSKFKIDFSNKNYTIGNYKAVILNANKVDYTSYFNVNVDNTNKQILISTASNKYIPVGTYSLKLTYSVDSATAYDYTINSTLKVTKPFKIKNLSVTTTDGLIYPDTSFNVVLSDYASTLKNQNLTYTVTKNAVDVTNLFNINYSSGKVSIGPKDKVESGIYTLSISINGNDLETINFEVHTAYSMNYTPQENNLVFTPSTTSQLYTADDVKKNISSVYGYSFLNNKNEEINPSLIGTGMKLKLYTTAKDYQTYTFIVVGDLSGDGKISTADYVRLWNHLDRSNSYMITDTNVLKAADLSSDNKLSTSDYVKLWNQLKRG